MPAPAVGWPRLALVVALIGVLTAVALLTPVGARSPVSRKWVRKAIARQVNSLREELSADIRATRLNASSVQLVGPRALDGAGTDITVATLSIPDAGNYMVVAKLWWNVVDATSTGAGGEIDCDLLAGGDFDTSRESGVTDFDYGTLSLQLTHSFSGPGTVTLRCRDEFTGGNPVEVHNVVITGVEVFFLGSTRLDRGTVRDPASVGVRP